MSLLSPPPYVIGKGGGDPHKIDVGTREAQPRGIESFLTYNGLKLNDRKLLDTYIVTQIEGLADADVRDSRDVNPGRHGETYFDAYYGGRTIVITGKIRAHTIWKLRDMQQALKQAFSDISVERPLTIGDITIDCKKSQPIAMTEIQQDFTYRRDFQVTLRASNPRFVSYKQEWLTWASNGPMEPGSTVGILSLENAGNFGAEPIVRIDGPVSSLLPGGPALTMAAATSLDGIITSQSFTINAKKGDTVAIPDGSYFLLDSSRRTLVQKVSNQVGAINVFSQLDISSDWSEFPPGPTVVELTAFGPSDPQVVVRYKHTYI